MTPEQLLKLLRAFRATNCLTKDDYFFFDKKIKELDFQLNKESDMDALEIRIENLIRKPKKTDDLV